MDDRGVKPPGKTCTAEFDNNFTATFYLHTVSSSGP